MKEHASEVQEVEKMYSRILEMFSDQLVIFRKIFQTFS